VLTNVLTVAVILCSGLIAGVFFDVALAMLPAFFAMPAGQFIDTNNRLGKGYHPTMPILCSATVLANLWLALLTAPPYRQLYLTATLLLFGTQFVSEFGNMRINRRLLKTDHTDLPADWSDPRRRWGGFHLLRTALAICAVALNGTALALLH
jgi:uncharacterized membrane protein